MPVNAEQKELSFEDTRPWDRLVREPSKVYRCFCIYRDIGPSRTLYEAYRRYRVEREDNNESVVQLRLIRTDLLETTPPASWKQWARKYRWQERAEAYDAAEQDQATKIRNQALEELRRKRLEQRLALDEIQYMRILRINSVLDETLQKPLAKMREERKDPNTGASQVREIDNLRVVETLSETTEALEGGYFSGVGQDEAAGDESAGIPVVGEFRWIEDPALAEAQEVKVIEAAKSDADN